MERRHILIIILVLILIGGGYYAYTRRSVILTQTPQAPTNTQYGENVRELRRLKSLSFDTSVFSDPRFRALKEPPPPPVASITFGRENPFLPLPGFEQNTQ